MLPRTLILLMTAALGAQAETREFTQSCNEIYPRIAQFMTTTAQFEPAVSDSAGGMLTMKYNGPTLGFYRGMKQLFNRYVVGGEKQRAGVSKGLYSLGFPYIALSYSRLSLSFVKTEAGGCSINLDLVLAGLTDSKQWAVVPSNGVAETELMDNFMTTLKPKGDQHAH